jgi:Protein of unknown function (DUF3105)
VAKTQKSSDRRAVVEQLRREQKRQERQRGLVVLGAAVAVGALILGFAVWQALKADSAGKRAITAIGGSPSSAGCQPVIVRKATGNQVHEPVGQKILYPDAPPADGPHWGNYLTGAEIRKFYTTDDRPPVERLVHSLEHGHTILWYDDTIAKNSDELADVQAIAKKFPSNTDPNDKFIAAPWTSADGKAFPDGKHVALTHWSMGGTNGNPKGQQGVWQYCSKVSGAAVEDFMAEYPYSDSPEPAAP